MPWSGNVLRGPRPAVRCPAGVLGPHVRGGVGPACHQRHVTGPRDPAPTDSEPGPPPADVQRRSAGRQRLGRRCRRRMGSVASEYRLKRRVQFHETDTAGIVHFSWFYRYMEEAEHALWRAAGLSIAPRDAVVGFPRVAASFDFHRPLRFEDEFEVHIRIARVGEKSIRYATRVTKDGESVATGSLTVACIDKRPGAPFRSTPIPAEIAESLQRFGSARRGVTVPPGGPAGPDPMPSSRNGPAGRRAAAACGSGRPAGRAAARAALHAGRAEPLLPAQVLRGRYRRRRIDAPRRHLGVAFHDEGRADRRPGRVAALGNSAHLPARALHALQPDVLDHRPASPLDRHARELAVDARLLEGPSTARRASRGRDRIFFPFSFGPFLGFWTAFDAATEIGAHAIPAGGMTSEQRLGLIETLAPTVVCCTPTYALRLLDVARAAPDRDPPAAGSVPHDHRGRRAGRQHPGDAPAYRARVGSARHRPPRADRGGSDQLRVSRGARLRARQRVGVHRRGDRPGQRRSGSGRAAGASSSSPTSAGRPAR